ncbi:hypothetical protein U1Q18_012154 [Sarracenia purpurea var. burkii]
MMAAYPGQEANHGLHLISPYRIPNKGQRLPSYNLEELKRVENRQFAPVGLPPPLHELGVGSPVLHAVLMLVDRPTRRVRVVRRVRVGNPFSGEDIAFLVAWYSC